ncbi:hypothetical protein FHG89_14695 [Micromonospora orduensis]|uniref:YnfA family protein n=1 Tax=Micromonospora orduensis TaxID=1420891 RepID=A0A5C4QTI8_9ACTN|nr:hypothetical protein FHG89_14695 [Micromonospora orduensis]
MLLFALTALAEIGGAWLIWHGVREDKGMLWIGVLAMGAPLPVREWHRDPVGAVRARPGTPC